MKRSGLLILTLLGFIGISFGQANWCGTQENLQRNFEENPGMDQIMYQNLVHRFANETPFTERGVNGTIPVVVHVIHDGGTGNVDMAQIQSALDILNEDYQKLNADTIDIRNTTEAPFSPIAANIGLTFELAKLDPNGNCTNGVVRVYAPHLTDQATDDCKFSSNGGSDAWPHDMYLNIWVVNSIESGGGAGITLGYAQFPYDAPPLYPFVPETYGIVIRHDSFGTNGTSTSDGETLTHEVGHCLGLFHTFEDIFDFSGDGCHTDDCQNAGDFICDTPPAAAATWACNDLQNTCTDIPTGDYFGIDAYDQFENWMSYDNCQSMFSEGQKTRIFTNFTDIPFMANLISSSNMTATGVGLPDVLCDADFYANNTVVCAGNSVDFYDLSYSNVSGVTWTFPGGTPGTSTSSNPTVTYNTPGIYAVTIDATDGTTTLTETKTDYILVLDNPGEPAPYFEGFELMSDLTDNNRFFLTGSGDVTTTWSHTDQEGIQGSKCAWVNNFNGSAGNTTEMVSNTIDLSWISASDPLLFTFQYSYKKRDANNDEWLQLYVSNDCGETWVLRKTLHGNALSTDVQTSEYTNVPDEDWNLITVTNIGATYYTENFRFKFIFQSDGGNNIYLDDINIWPESMTGMVEFEENSGLSIYPNPATDNAVIELFGEDHENCTIELISPLGQKIETIYEGQLTNGVNKFDFSMTNLPNGVYLVRISSEGRLQTVKLIKE